MTETEMEKRPAGSRFKFAFQDVNKTNGQLLTIHHTVTENGQRKRIQMVRQDFNATGDLVALDHRGTVFLFNLSRQNYVILPETIKKCSCIRFHPSQQKELIAGTKDGSLLLMEYCVADNTTTTITDHETDAFGWATAGAKQIFEASSPVTAKIKLKTQPYPPGGHPIINLSFPTSATTFSTGNAFLSVTSTQCTVHNLVTFEKLYHVDTMDCHTVKQAMYLPSFDFVLLGICGDDTLRVWGMDIGSTEEDLSHAEDTGMHQSSGFRRRFEVIAMREEFLQQRRAEAAVTLNLKRSTSSENVFESLRKDFSQGYLTAVACSRIPGRVIVATLDSTLIVFSTNDGDFQVKRVLRLANEVYVTKIDFLLSELPEADLVICRTSVGDLVVIDLMAPPNGDENRQEKPKLRPVIPFLVVEGNCEGFAFSPNYKLFAVQTKLGELDLYSMDFILRRMEKELDKRNALKEGGGKKKKAHLSKEQVDSVHREIQPLLPRKRLIAILNEYNEYPQRQVVWRSLLKLPNNDSTFCELLRKGYHPCVSSFDKQFPLKSRAALRNLKKIVSCLAHWSPAFAVSDFVPHFVFPFLKVHEMNLLFTFEVCATVLLNHGQLLFEFAPREPFNYLGMIENLIAHYDPKLMDFFMRRKVTSKTFAWPIVQTAFAEVLDTTQWLQLWDHLVTNTPDFLVFAAVAYNITQRPVVMRLESLEEIECFFRDQNLIDMKRLLRKAYTLARDCPESLQPRQYLRSFTPLLSPVYQKFYNYPREVVDRSVAERERRALERDALQMKMEEVAIAENKMLEKLERQLADEEHSRRLAEVERALDEVMVNDALEAANQHHILALCEREHRNKELESAADLNMCLVRQRTQARELELENLLRAVDKERIGEQMEQQLCEERRQMVDVENEVKKRLLASTVKLQHSRRPAETRTATTRNTIISGSATAAAAAVATQSSKDGDNCKRRTIAAPPTVRTTRNKLMKYSDKFRRS